MNLAKGRFSAWVSHRRVAPYRCGIVRRISPATAFRLWKISYKERGSRRSVAKWQRTIVPYPHRGVKPMR